jgi:hypothetical protein
VNPLSTPWTDALLDPPSPPTGRFGALETCRSSD